MTGILLSLKVQLSIFRRDDMKVKTMIVTAIAFWAYVALCLYVMGKLAGAI